MTTHKLDALPKELIAHIATYAEASTVLSLTKVNKAIRAACHDSLVFKSILVSSQKQHWSNSTLDVGAIANRAGDSADIWARYALADEKATKLAQEGHPSQKPQSCMNYMPELLVVKHPIAAEQGWKHFVPKPLNQTPTENFCIAMAILAKDENRSQPVATVKPHYTEWLYGHGGETSSCLWALCIVATSIRASLRIRLSAWPYNSAAVVPYVKPPNALQIPLRPLSDNYSVPSPFSRKSTEVLDESTSSSSDWSIWYSLHNYETFRSSSYLTGGEWCGYYTYFGMNEIRLDPPMTQIIFKYSTRKPVDGQLPRESEAVYLEATDCTDGLARFDIQATMSHVEGMVNFQARKQYQGSSTGWDWECRLTPFGIVGLWGTRTTDQSGKLSELGIVWLWKKQWTDDSQ